MSASYDICGIHVCMDILPNDAPIGSFGPPEKRKRVQVLSLKRATPSSFTPHRLPRSPKFLALLLHLPDRRTRSVNSYAHSHTQD